MTAVNAVALGGFLLAIAWSARWVVRRARRGYSMVQALMAQVEAHASAEATAAASAQNRVDVRVGESNGSAAMVRAVADLSAQVSELHAHLASLGGGSVRTTFAHLPAPAGPEPCDRCSAGRHDQCFFCEGGERCQCEGGSL